MRTVEVSLVPGAQAILWNRHACLGSRKRIWTGIDHHQPQLRDRCRQIRPLRSIGLIQPYSTDPLRITSSLNRHFLLNRHIYDIEDNAFQP